jgi:hypothetical protein
MKMGVRNSLNAHFYARNGWLARIGAAVSDLPDA